MTQSFRCCAIIPTYINPDTIGVVVDGVRARIADVVVVDDGSSAPGHAAVEALSSIHNVHIHHRKTNGGKGAAVKDGLRIADRMRFTHALQIDADGQHDLGDIPRFLEVARSQPEALVLGAPVFSDEAPWSRVMGRRITCFWTRIETYGRRTIHDPLCGFRIYPIGEALRTETKGNAMDFDPEIAVRMVWQNVPVVNVPTRVRYLDQEMGGVSHFRLVRDNIRISWMHTRLVTGAIFRLMAPW